MHEPDEQDDLDRLFLQLPATTPPPDVGVRARTRLRAIRAARTLTLVALIDLVALTALAILAFQLGATVASSELPVLLRLVVEDRTVALEARREIAIALVQATPWLNVVGLTVDLLLLIAVTRYLLRKTEAVAMPGVA